MYYDRRTMYFLPRFSRTSARPARLLQKVVLAVATTTVFAVALMFSVVLLAVALTVGAVAVGYLWWKTRGIRRRMQQRRPTGGEVIEGVVIREVDS